MSTTKVVSFRVPLEDYADLLAKAKESNMNVADFVIFAIFSDRQTLLRADRRVMRMEKEVTDHKDELAELRLLLESKNKEIATLNAALASRKAVLSAAIEKHNDFVEELKKGFEKMHDESVFTSFKPFIELAGRNFWKLA